MSGVKGMAWQTREVRGNYDYGTAAGAAVLVERIKAYWRIRGHFPYVAAVETESKGPNMFSQPRFEVYSDMIGGRPCSAGPNGP